MKKITLIAASIMMSVFVFGQEEIASGNFTGITVAGECDAGRGYTGTQDVRRNDVPADGTWYRCGSGLDVISDGGNDVVRLIKDKSTGLRQTLSGLASIAGEAYRIKLSVKQAPTGDQNTQDLNIYIRNIHDTQIQLSGFAEATGITYDANFVVTPTQVSIKPGAFDTSGYTVFEFDYIPEDASQIALYIPGSDDSVFDNTTNDPTSAGYINGQDPDVGTMVFQSNGILQIQRGKGAGTEADTYIDNVSMSKYTLSTKDLIKFDFSFYPNPSTDRINLSAAKNIEHVEFFNLLGQSVLKNELNLRKATIDMSSFSKGVYIMKLAIDGVEGAYKIIKE